MNTSKKSTLDQIPPNRAAGIIASLKSRGVPVSVTWDEDGVAIDAYVPSARAARMLAPLGRKAVGKFQAMPGNMVLISAIVTPRQVERMLAAALPTA